MITPITGDYTLPKAQIFFRPEGGDAFEDLGDADGFELTIEPEEIERYANNLGTRRKVESRIVQTDVTIEMVLVQMTNRARALSIAGDAAAATQSAAVGQTVTVEAVAAGGIYQIPHFALSGVSVDDGEDPAVAYALGTHYELDAAAGLIRVVARPGGAGEDMVVSYDAAAILAGDGKLLSGIAQNLDIRGTLIVRGVNDIGRRSFLQLHRVVLRPGGARTFVQDGTEWATATISGDVLDEPAQPAGFEYGFERTL